MNRLLRNGLAVVSVLVVLSACDRTNGRFPPTAPTPPPPIVGPPPAPPGASPTATPVTVGETVSKVVSISDPTCASGTIDPPEPCQRFAIAISTSGVLKVQVRAPGPSMLTLGVGPLRAWGTTTLSRDVGVQAGSVYEISVALHGVVDGHTSQAFELTTSLDPH